MGPVGCARFGCPLLSKPSKSWEANRYKILDEESFSSVRTPATSSTYLHRNLYVGGKPGY